MTNLTPSSGSPAEALRLAIEEIAEFYVDHERAGRSNQVWVATAQALLDRDGSGLREGFKLSLWLRAVARARAL